MDKSKVLKPSFVGRLLTEGFDVAGVYLNNNQFVLQKKQIALNLNWFGVSIYAPDNIFKKGDKEVIMSLQGITAPYNPMYKELFDNMAVKYIKLSIGDKAIYENWTGILPGQEIVEQFLCAKEVK